MSFGSKKHTTAWISIGLALVVPLSVLATASDDVLIATKDEFNQLWHAAAETTKKRATLEQVLAGFDDKVASAKKDLEKASEQRKVIREHIAEHKVFIEALQGQLHAAADARAFYDSVAIGQRDDFVQFLRYMTSRNIALHESGPAAGGPLLKTIIRGSLGESIDRQLTFEAVVKARAQFLGQLRVLMSESDRVQERLRDVAEEYAAELKLLEDEHRSIATIVDTTTQFIDNSWKEKKLTQEELRSVAEEANEANARIAAMQASLVEINDELKQKTLQKFEQQLVPLEAEKKGLEGDRDVLKRKDTAMSFIEAAAEKAYKQAVAAKGTDKKLYQKIELKKLQRKNASDELELLASQNTETDSEALKQKIDALHATISFIDATVPYLIDGVPLDLAEAYVTAKRSGDQATLTRASLGKQIDALTEHIREIEGKIAATKAASDLAAEKYDLASDLPPIFRWPVSGPITAGFLDAAYETVFHVPHRAIDIAVVQGTPIRSISDGIVFAVKDGGATGYSYVLIGHRNGYASLYGHVSAFLVSKGDVVSAGQMIALSGGKPGTHGAGFMTTGAHLHLEITKDGAHIDPLSVLTKS